MMRLAVAVAALLAAWLPAGVSARTLSFDDVRRIVSFGEPQISPDGRRIAIVLGRINYPKDRTDSNLMLVDVRTRRMRQLTFDRRGVSTPRWSPDGTRLAFLSSAKAETETQAHEQIFVLKMAGGEAQQITKTSEGVDSYVWSPDGSRIAYVTQDPNPYERQIKEHLDAFEVGDNDYLHTAAAIPSHLWVISSDGKKARRVTEGSWSLGTVDPSVTSGLSWSSDGSHIAFIRFPTPLIGDSLGGRIELVNTRSGSLTRLTGNGGLEGAAEFAPSGDTIAYSRSTGGDPANGDSVYLTHPGGGPGRRIPIDRTINGKVWARNGLWLFGPDGPRVAAWFVPSNGSVRRLNLGQLALTRSGNVAKNGALTFVATTNSHPAELYYLASPSAHPVRLTNQNGFISRLQLGSVRSVSWGNDRFTEDGVLTLPPSFSAHGRRFPLVLLIHGGPQSASLEGWSSQRQLFASHGYLVFEPNYRGSTNLGDPYQHAIKYDAGDGPGRDVMAGVKTVERTYPVDTRRIGVSGWSYGGYMTSWMTGHYDIWRVAVAGAALNDWFDDYNIAFYVHTDVPYFGGSPWNPKYTAMWRAQSPITYAQHIHAPTLIMGDIGDNNVTITNSFKMYHALKDNGVTVQFVAYPVHGHFPGDPVRSEDVTRRWLAWLDKYLK